LEKRREGIRGMIWRFLSDGGNKIQGIRFLLVQRPQKRTGAAHQHTAPATIILVVLVRKGEKNKKRISSRSSPIEKPILLSIAYPIHIVISRIISMLWLSLMGKSLKGQGIYCPATSSGI
jgi:hypothetical protein